jgi:predicted N-formylglutamate amidohydrolase
VPTFERKRPEAARSEPKASGVEKVASDEWTTPEGRGEDRFPNQRRLLVTCEHGGHRVPRRHRALFAGANALLASHRGWDPGALDVARRLALAWHAPLLAATTTRLLVDLNRSPHNPAVFSKLTRGLPRDQRDALRSGIHRPHWDRVRAAVRARAGTVLHLAIHSFTPVLRGVARDFGIGILYDPKRRREQEHALAWQRRLSGALPGVGVRRNAPYRGDSDGLTTALRREFPARRYLGIELELNQRMIASIAQRRALAAVLANLLH